MRVVGALLRALGEESNMNVLFYALFAAAGLGGVYYDRYIHEPKYPVTCDIRGQEAAARRIAGIPYVIAPHQERADKLRDYIASGGTSSGQVTSDLFIPYLSSARAELDEELFRIQKYRKMESRLRQNLAACTMQGEEFTQFQQQQAAREEAARRQAEADEAARQLLAQEQAELEAVRGASLNILRSRGKYTKAEIKEAFREASRSAHPDRGGSEAQFRQLVSIRNEALKFARDR